MEQGVWYAPYIPVILREVIEAKSRQLKDEWIFEQDKPKIYHGFEMYVYTPMPDNVRIELSNIPFKFKLAPWNFMEWIVCQNMQAEMKREIDKDMIKLISQYK